MRNSENDEYEWRETYFVHFSSTRRPTMAQLEAALKKVNANFEFRDQSTGELNSFESATIVSPDDFSAMDISYDEGDEVRDQGAELATTLEADCTQKSVFEKLRSSNARFEVMHFELVTRDEEDALEERFDPCGLLSVLSALTKLTGGVAIDPQSGSAI